MNILLVHNYYQIPGGEDTVVANEKKMLEQHGNRVILYSRDNSELKRMSALHKLLLPLTAVFSLKTYRSIRNLIKAEEIEVVHVHNTLSLVSPAVYYAALHCGVPVVQTVHNFRLLCPGAMFYRDGHTCEDCVTRGLLCAVRHKCYRGSRLQTLACVVSTWIHRMTGVYGKLHYICLTEFNRQKLLLLKQIRPEQVFVKPNFVEAPAHIIPEQQRREQYIYAGRLDRMKGVEVLLKAWQHMGPSAPKLLVCGTGPLEDWCRTFVRDNGMANVEMPGFLPNDRVRQLVGESRAMILPTQWYEGFPMAIAEAFSAGTPVVVPDMGNAGSLVEEGVTGTKFARATPEAIADAVMRLRGYGSLQKSVLDVCSRSYTQDKNYEQLTAVYAAAVNSRRGMRSCDFL